MNAYSYIRFSTPEQRHGFSFDRQSEGSIALCQRHDWKLDDSVRLADLGRSGFHGHQVVLKAFIRAIEAGEVKTPSVLIVEKLDRLSREEIDDAYNLWRTILKHGVLIATVSPERIYDKASLNRITDIMEALLHFMVAHEESQKKSDRAKDNWQRKRNNSTESGKPITGKRPAWIDSDFKLIEPKAAVIRDIFKMAIDGHGARSILRHLNESRTPNIALGYCSKSKTTWNLRYVESLLQDKKTFGEHQVFTGDIRHRVPHGPPVKQYFPSVITEETFYRAQAARKSRATQRGPNGREIANIFQGLLVDGSGNSFRLQNSSPMDKKRGINRRLAVEKQSVPACLFETLLLRAVREIDVELSKPSDDPLPALEAKLCELETDIAAMKATLKKKRSSSLMEVLTDLDHQRESVLAQIEAAKSVVEIDHKSVVRVVDQLERATDKEPLRRKVKAMLRHTVKQITLTITDIKGNRLHKSWNVHVEFHDWRRTQMSVVTYKGNVVSCNVGCKPEKLPEIPGTFIGAFGVRHATTV